MEMHNDAVPISIFRISQDDSPVRIPVCHTILRKIVLTVEERGLGIFQDYKFKRQTNDIKAC